MPKVTVGNKNPRNRKPMTDKEYQRAFDIAMKKFKKAVDAAGTLQDLKRKEYYETPSMAKVRLKKQAKARWRKKLQQSQKRLY